MSNNNKNGGTPLLNIVETRSLDDIDLNLMADPWSDSDEDSDNNKDTLSKKKGPINDLGLVEKKLENLKKNMDEFSSDEKPESSVSPTNQLSSKGPPKDNEIPLSSPQKHIAAPPSTHGPPKDISPTMNSLSLTGASTDMTSGNNSSNPLNGAYGSLYDPSKITAPTTYTRGRKSRQKPGKKFATHQIGRFDPEHMDSTSSSKKKEKKISPKSQKAPLIPEPVVSTTVISSDTPGLYIYLMYKYV